MAKKPTIVPKPQVQPRVLDQEFKQLAELLDKRCRTGALADDYRDVMGGLMSIAFLIEDAVDAGNDDLDGMQAFGLVRPIRDYAKRVGQLYYRSLLELKGVTREQLDEKH